MNVIDAPRARTARHDALDLSALAWVQNELRRSLDSAHKALRRFVRESQTLSDSDVDVVDPSILRVARRQLHQGIGALELVGLPDAARLLRAGESVVQRFAGRPGALGLPAVEAIEHASFALLDYIGRLLAGQRVAPLALFPQYRAVQEYAGADRIHPADLWPNHWRWLDLPDDPAAPPAAPDAAMQRALEQQLLALMKSAPGSAGFEAASERMSTICARLGAGLQRAVGRPRAATLWKLAAAVFEAQARGLLRPDVYSKRVASRLLPQFRQLDQGDDGEAFERLAQDLLFFCAQAAAPADAAAAPRLAAVRAVYGLGAHEPVDYGAASLGRFDPAAISQARKRVVTAKESWAAVTAGETDRLGVLAEQFALVGDSLGKLYPAGDRLADALQAALVVAQESGAASVSAALAMEVATSLLYLEASLEDAELDQPAQGDRAQRLAERIDAVRAGAAPAPLEPWIKDLYRRISDRQTIGSVVQELREALAASEKLIDQYFRRPDETAVLLPVPQQLQAMRGVLSVLALDQASLAVLRMRHDIDRLLSMDVAGDEAARSAVFERLAANLGALGFLIDMFSVQPQMAQALFAFDEARGLLEAVGDPVPASSAADARAAGVEPGDDADTDADPASAFAPDSDFQPLSPDPLSLHLPPPAAPRAMPADRAGGRAEGPDAVSQAAVPPAFGADSEMREVFLEEAREVLADAAVSLAELRHAADDLPPLTTLRRAFHTLKGSSRMVGLSEFGDAAWMVEQVFNTRLAEHRSADPRLHDFTERVLGSLARWVDAIAEGRGIDRRAAGEIVAAHDIYVAAAAPPAHDAGAPATGAEAAAAVRAATVPPATALPASIVPSPLPAAPPADAPVFNDTTGFEVPLEFDWEPAADAVPAPATVAPRGSPPAGFPAGLPSAADLDLPRAAASPAAPAEAPAQDRAPEAGDASEDGPAVPAIAGLEAASPAASVDASDVEGPVDALPAADGIDLDFPALGPAGVLANAPPAIEPPLAADHAATPFAPFTPAAAPGPAAAEGAAASGFDLAFDTFSLSIPAAAAPGAAVHDAPAGAQPDAPSAALQDADSPPDAAPDETAALPVGDAFTALAGPDLDLDFGFEFDTGAAADAATTIGSDASVADAPAAVDLPIDDVGVKVVGPLRVGLPLFNIYINEAEDLSRRLAARLADWTHALDTPVGEEAVALAHSLAGSSATVGFTDLSQLARALEHALTQADGLGRASIDDARLFVGVAEEIRHLLHEFAGGVLKVPPPELFDALAECEAALALQRQARGSAEAESGYDGAAGAAAVDSGSEHAFADTGRQSDDAAATQLDASLSPVAPTQLAPLDEAHDFAAAAARAPGAAQEPASEAQPPAVAAQPQGSPVLSVAEGHDVAVAAVQTPSAADDAAPADMAGHVTVEAPADADAGAPASSVAAALASPAPAIESTPAAAALGVPAFSALAEQPSDAAPRAVPLRADAPDADDDIDAVDAVDAELFAVFVEEAHELLPQLASRLRDWAANTHDAAAPAGAMRTLHTLKGAARLAGAMRLGEMCHRMETRIGHLLAAPPIAVAGIEALQGRCDALVAGLDALSGGAPAQPAATPAEAARAAVSAALPALPVPTGPSDAPSSGLPFAPLPAQAAPPRAEAAPPAAFVEAASPPPPEAVAAKPADRGAGPDSDAMDWSRFTLASGAAPRQAEPAVAVQSTVRVRTPLLDRMVNQAGEVSITRTRVGSEVQRIKSSLGDLSENLERLRRQLRDLELQAELQINSRLEAAKAAAQAFDPLEFDRYTRFQELTRMISESVNDVATVQRTLTRANEGAEDALAAQGRLTRELQDDLLRTRMVEFEGQADRLYRVVRQAAKETGKHVRLDILGGAIEIDRGVIDRMLSSFEHLLRNAVAHGIETPGARRAAGKDETGSIVVALEHVGNEVAVDFRDDGGGLDLARIRSRAVASGLIAPDAAPSDAELAALVFEPGFTTAEQVTELAGRGVGLDVVRNEVAAVGGRIESASTLGKGTSFRLVLPLTTAVTQVLMVRCGGLRVALPSTLVETVQRVEPDALQSAYDSGSHPHAGAALPFFWLGALLAGDRRSEESSQARFVVIVRSAQQRVALHVDEVLGNQEAVVKNLGPQLARMPGLAGMTLLPSGDVALIYNPVALATVYGESARATMAGAAAAGAAMHGASALAADAAGTRAPPLVLVVDDSLTVRRVTQRLLEREGFRVAVAKDGLDALARLAEEKPAVVLSDIEMPRMDGFDLVRNLRAQPALADLPVIMITSRIAHKHRDYAAELGVDHYLGKPYSEEALLALVRGYTAVAAPLH